MRLDDLRTFARAWLPAPHQRQRRANGCAPSPAPALGLLFTGAALPDRAGSSIDSRWLIAPLGASAVLVFALPASPLAQPWSVIGGNTFSALVGVACARWMPDAGVGRRSRDRAGHRR